MDARKRPRSTRPAAHSSRLRSDRTRPDRFLAALAFCVLALHLSTAANAEPAARVTLGPTNQGINASTFSSGSFEVENLSNAAEQIVRVELDLSTAILPDLVFDPSDGTPAGDLTTKSFTPDFGDTSTGLQTHSFSLENEDGYFGLEILFDAFDANDNPSGTDFSFSIDTDPTSIQGSGSPGPSGSGSVSGLELSGTTVTVEFDDGTILTARTFAIEGSQSASEVILESARPSAPSLSLLGLSAPTTVVQASQTVRIQGTPGADVALLLVEGALFTQDVPGGGFDLEPFESNAAIKVLELQATLDTIGAVDIPVTLTRSQAEGGINILIAVEIDAQGATSDPSNIATVEYDDLLEQPSFIKSTLGGTALINPTSLRFGLDGLLYVGQQNGLIQVLTVVKNGVEDFDVIATETIDLVQAIPNHNDDGTPNPAIKTRQVTGLLVTGTPLNPVIYVGSSDPRIGGGSSGTDESLDTNSGILSRLTWNGISWDKLDLVRGLPRSEENHSINGLQLDEATNILYAAIGGSTNMGAPSNNFALIPEYALSAAILAIDLDAIGDTTYDLPTLDDEDRVGLVDLNDPFGGNNGKNQAAIESNGPVAIYSPGFRNAYDLVLTQGNVLYTIDNGANGGWGDVPEMEGPPTGNPLCTNAVQEPGVKTPDALHLVTEGYYGGHPNPTRANRNNLLALLGNWGSCAGCPSDVNGDGDVNILDLLTILGAWGSCFPL